MEFSKYMIVQHFLWIPLVLVIRSFIHYKVVFYCQTVLELNRSKHAKPLSRPIQRCNTMVYFFRSGQGSLDNFPYCTPHFFYYFLQTLQVPCFVYCKFVSIQSSSKNKTHIDIVL